MKVFVKVDFLFYEDCSRGANVLDLSEKQIEDLKAIFDAWQKAELDPCEYDHKLPEENLDNYFEETIKSFNDIFENAKGTDFEADTMEECFKKINAFMEEKDLFPIAVCHDSCGGLYRYKIIKL